ncbi:MAG TPA: hypothetical protein DIC30_04075 [Oceanospirillales bacterium]|nr:hypothetical protein [Oceanospirillales bacterium]
MYSIILHVACSIIFSLFVSDAHAGQDPMRPPNWGNPIHSSPIQNETINLQQILISKDRKVVIINDKIFTEGQSINGNKIIKIEADQIKIRRRGVSKVIKLLPSTKGVKREI